MMTTVKVGALVSMMAVVLATVSGCAEEAPPPEEPTAAGTEREEARPSEDETRAEREVAPVIATKVDLQGKKTTGDGF